MARPAAKKEVIEQAAIRLFATHGLVGTTIKVIAAEAGVTEGALYRHYPSKDEMAWKLYCREVEKFSTGLEAVLTETGGSLADRLATGIEFFYRYYKDQPDTLVFVLFARQGFPEHFLVDEGIDPDHTILRFIRREIKAGTIPKADAMLMMSMVRGLVLEPVLMHRYGKLKSHPLKSAALVAGAIRRVLEG